LEGREVGFYRKSIKLKNYDYSKSGVYFITICTIDHTCIFGEVLGGVMKMNDYGTIAQRCWNDVPKHFPNVKVDVYVIMPNHIHGILWLMETVVDVGKKHTSSLHLQPLNTIPTFKKTKLCHIIGSFKSAITRRINIARGSPGKSLWQKSYYEHIIRDDISLNKIRKYILFNPLIWYKHRENYINF
jgi:REP-associated tyrosine transposase